MTNAMIRLAKGELSSDVLVLPLDESPTPFLSSYNFNDVGGENE